MALTNLGRGGCPGCSRGWLFFDHTLKTPTREVQIGSYRNGPGSGAAPRHCLASGPPTKRTKSVPNTGKIYRYLPLLTLSNLFRVNSRWVDGDRVKMALYR